MRCPYSDANPALPWYADCIKPLTRPLSGSVLFGAMPSGKGYGIAMKNSEKPIANPFVVLREEFDDWAILFDPDSGNAFGLSPTGVYLWKHLDGEHSIDDMLKALRGDVHDVPQDAGGHLATFVEELTRHGLAGYDVEAAHDGRGRIPACPTCISEKVADAMQFAYEPPKLVDLSGEQAAHGACSGGSAASGGCSSGNFASCYSGCSATYYDSCDSGGCPTCIGCCGGASAHYGCGGGVWDTTGCNSGRCVFEVCCNSGSGH
jgi:SynChlorMet cassette protein ScmD